MNLIQFMAKKLHQGPVLIDSMVNSTEIVVHSKMNFMKIVQNQLLFRKPLMLCAQLISQDRIVAYSEIKTTLGISKTSIHSLLHDHLTVKKISSPWIPHNLSIAQKRLVSIGRKKKLKNYDSGASKHVMNRGFTLMSPKVNGSRLYGCFKMSQI